MTISGDQDLNSDGGKVQDVYLYHHVKDTGAELKTNSNREEKLIRVGGKLSVSFQKKEEGVM